MGGVRFALKFLCTFYVLAAFAMFLGTTSIVSMPTDNFPEIGIPVVLDGGPNCIRLKSAS
jgi:multidrug efflux pump subunit AcrB